MENKEFEEVKFKIVYVIGLMTSEKLKVLILIMFQQMKLVHHISIDNISYKALIGLKLLRIRLDKVMDLLELMMELDALSYLTMKNLMTFNIELDLSQLQTVE